MPQGHAKRRLSQKRRLLLKHRLLQQTQPSKKICNCILESETFGARWVGGKQLAQVEDGYNLGSQETMESSACDGLLGGRPGDF